MNRKIGHARTMAIYTMGGFGSRGVFFFISVGVSCIALAIRHDLVFFFKKLTHSNIKMTLRINADSTLNKRCMSVLARCFVIEATLHSMAVCSPKHSFWGHQVLNALINGVICVVIITVP